jgi:DNA-binding response OmpR family regulator
MKLLLVEDDKEAAAYLKRVLSEAGHMIDYAATGREGQMLAAAEAYDVIVLDRMFPWPRAELAAQPIAMPLLAPTADNPQSVRSRVLDRHRQGVPVQEGVGPTIGAPTAPRSGCSDRPHGLVVGH